MKNAKTHNKLVAHLCIESKWRLNYAKASLSKLRHAKTSLGRLRYYIALSGELPVSFPNILLNKIAFPDPVLKYFSRLLTCDSV